MAKEELKFCILITISTFAFAGVQDVPLGHMQPFGKHTEPSSIEERNNIPTAQEFWEKYARELKPVLFKGIAKNSPVFTKWTDDYLKENYGDMEMRVEQKRETNKKIVIGDKGFARDTLRNFINTYHSNTTTKYVISELPKAMYKDFLVPPFVTCGSFGQRLVEVDLWIGGGGSSSLIHKDAFHIINCLFNGTKEWKMIETKYERDIYKVQEEPGRLSGYSPIDPLKVDILQYPRVAKVPWAFVNVSAGDCLYIPKSMFHQVRSFGSHNLAISLLFSRFDEEKALNFSDCQKEDYKPLSEMESDWEYEGKGPFSMGNDDLEYGTRSHLLSGLNENDTLDRAALSDFIKNLETYTRTGMSDQEVDEVVKNVYATLGKTVEDGLTKSEILNLTKRQLREITRQWHIPDPYNTYDYEYFHLSPVDIADTLIYLVKRDEHLHKDEFIQLYTSRIGGTLSHANDLFNKLGGGNESDSIPKNTVAEHIDQALYPYDERHLEYHGSPEYGSNKTRMRTDSDYKGYFLSNGKLPVRKEAEQGDEEGETGEEGSQDEDEGNNEGGGEEEEEEEEEENQPDEEGERGEGEEEEEQEGDEEEREDPNAADNEEEQQNEGQTTNTKPKDEL